MKIDSRWLIDSIDLDENELMKLVKNNFSPEDIFDYSQLETWAVENDFVKKERP